MDVVREFRGCGNSFHEWDPYCLLRARPSCGGGEAYTLSYWKMALFTDVAKPGTSEPELWIC